MYAGIGQSLGSLIGGALCKRYGISKAFQYCAWLDFAMLIAFLSYQLIQKWKGETPATVQFDQPSGLEPPKENKIKPLPLVVLSKEQRFDRFLKKLLVLFNTLYGDFRFKILQVARSIKFR